MPIRHRISPVDTAWLRMDRPSNLMQIVGVMLFDGDLDYERLQRSIERRMLSFRRFRQIVRQVAGIYYWEDDQDFVLEHHLRRAAIGGLARFVGRHLMKPRWAGRRSSCAFITA